MLHLSLRQWLILYAVLLIAIGAIAYDLTRVPDGKFHVYMLDVGQGDSILLVTPSGKQIIVDGGPDYSTLEHLGRIMPFFDRTIDMLVLTHPNLDHIAAFPEIVNRYRVGQVMMTGGTYELGSYDRLFAEMRRKKVPVLVPEPSKDIDLGDGVTLDMIWPAENLVGKELDYKETNNTSIVMRVLYKDQAILFTGDMEEKAEREVLETGQDINSTVLKVAHHGSHTSTSTGWLLASSPETAIISAGRDNSYGHPHADIIDRLHGLGIQERVTAREGTIELVFD